MRTNGAILGTMLKRLRHLQHIEWSWSLALLVLGAIGSFSIPAWAVYMTGVFVEYSPLSWVLAGFAGLGFWAACYALMAWGRRVQIKSNYDSELFRKTGYVDPFAQSFENKRIHLSDFVLPSNPIIENKTFIECELIGPAILFMDERNYVNDLMVPKVDGILVANDAHPWNVVILRGCQFRKCRFIRVSLAIRESEFNAFNDPNYVNWITSHPERQLNLGLQSPGPSHSTPASPQAIETDAPDARSQS